MKNRMREPVKEEQGIHKKWYEEAKKMTLKDLPKFIEKLDEMYEHDYGTVCHSIAAAALATANAMNRGKGSRGGITGFQSGAVMWQFITGWGLYEKDAPLHIIDYNDMLYPQSVGKFTEISADTWEHLQKEAKTRLKEDKDKSAHPNVRAHWQLIIDGVVPFGYKIEK